MFFSVFLLLLFCYFDFRVVFVYKRDAFSLMHYIFAREKFEIWK